MHFIVYEAKVDGKTQIDKHKKANNHGTQAAVVRLLADLYLGNTDDFTAAAEMYKAYLGDPGSYSGGFNWGDLCWQADPNNPVGINRQGSTMSISGSARDVSGILPDEQRRSGCPSGWPPPPQNYVWGGLQGIVGQAYLLSRNGYDAWEGGDRAIVRAMDWHKAHGYTASGDDLSILPLIDMAYGTNFWDGSAVGYGKVYGWTDWTHQGTPFLQGDLDGDGAVDLADLRKLTRMLTGQEPANDEAKGLASPSNQLTLGDARELIELLVQP